jgi:hypothetical protein
MHLKFDTYDNITKMQFYDYEKMANMDIIEMKALKASFQINKKTGECV